MSLTSPAVSAPVSSTPRQPWSRWFTFRARLPLTSVARAQPLDRDEMHEARRHGDPRDYLVLRAWSSRRGVSITLDDAQDPHPRWVVTSRHPARLADAVREAAVAALRDWQRHFDDRIHLELTRCGFEGEEGFNAFAENGTGSASGDQTAVSTPFRMPQTSAPRDAMTPSSPIPYSGRSNSVA